MITYLIHAKLKDGTVINGEVKSEKTCFEIGRMVFMPEAIEMIISIKPNYEEKILQTQTNFNNASR